MPWTSAHMKWLIDTGERLQTTDGKEVAVWEFCHEANEAVLSAWAKHFRNHYCLDSDIDFLRNGYGHSRKEYLNSIKFPDARLTPGPSIRSGDFAEILVADYLESHLNYWVPRTRYGNKAIRNESIKGTDIIGFKILKDGDASLEDTLAVFETKAQFSGRNGMGHLQDAINDSLKDIVRKAESLNAIRQRFYDSNDFANANKIGRFQNEVDKPYKEHYGAVALFEGPLFNSNLMSSTDSSSHPKINALSLVIIKGEQMMKLVNELYRRAADEA